METDIKVTLTKGMLNQIQSNLNNDVRNAVLENILDAPTGHDALHRSGLLGKWFAEHIDPDSGKPGLFDAIDKIEARAPENTLELTDKLVRGYIEREAQLAVGNDEIDLTEQIEVGVTYIYGLRQAHNSRSLEDVAPEENES